MEALYLIPVLTALIGIVTAFLSGIYYGMSLDDFKEIEKNNPDVFKTLQDEKRVFSDEDNSFFCLEYFMYFITGATIVYPMIEVSKYSYECLYVLPAIIIMILLLRTVFYAFGTNYRGKNAEKFTHLLRLFMAIITPFEKIIFAIDRKISKYDDNEDSLQELSALVDTVCEAADEKEGQIGEYTLLRNVIKFGDVLVSDIMTPRTVIFSRAADETVGDIVNLPEIQMYSRFPVHEGESLDDGVVGYVMSKDVFRAALNENKNLKLRELARELHFVPENSGLESTLDLLLQQKQILLLVVDEYGGVEGLISMEDVIETMLGAEIVDEADKVADLREVAKQRRDKRIAEIIAKNKEN